MFGLLAFWLGWLLFFAMSTVSTESAMIFGGAPEEPDGSLSSDDQAYETGATPGYSGLVPVRPDHMLMNAISFVRHVLWNKRTEDSVAEKQRLQQQRLRAERNRRLLLDNDFFKNHHSQDRDFGRFF